MSISEGNFEQPRKVIGYWLSEKKSQKINWTDFSNVCRRYGYNLVKLNLDIPLEDQGPFHVILHKLTDIIVKALQNDEKAVRMMRHVEDYIERHEEVTVIDPLPNVKKLLDRSSPYRTIRDSHLNEFGIFTPAFVELTSEDSYVNLQRLKKAGVTFPFICKPSVSHGSSDCHKMAVIFSEAGLKDCKLPCVAQAFVNHNALLFKVYILGEQYYIVERPSLKNFYPCDHATIFFNSHDVSKSDSTSSLSILDPDEELHQEHIAADPDKVKLIVHTLTNVLGLSLFGVDIVVENNTGRHAIIDINSYPGYDGYPNFFEHLMKCVVKTVEDHEQTLSSKKNNSISLSSPIVSSNPLKFITNNSPNSLKMTTNLRNGQITIVGNGHVDEDEVNEGNDDILNSNKTINEHFSNKNSNLIAANKNNIDVSASDRDIEVPDTNINASDSDKKIYLLEHQQQRVRTVTGSKKSVERQL